MAKNRFSCEYEIRCSVKLLFGCLTTPSDLEDWFADKVNFVDNQTLEMLWDECWHRAYIQNKRCTASNCHVKYVFQDSKDDPNFIEFKAEHNQMTRTSFLKVVDYSEMTEEEAKSLWDNLIGNLRHKIGG